MMKQLLIALFATFVLFVPKTYAHTYLESTNPTDGANVTEDIQKIELKYSGKIEEGSIFKILASDGTEFGIESITLNDGVLTGTLASPLPNDTYTVEWDTISEDGHPLSGSFSFTVNAPDSAASGAGKDSTANTKNTEATNNTTNTETNEKNTAKADEGSTWTLIIVVAIIFVALAFIAHYAYYRAFRKKDK